VIGKKREKKHKMVHFSYGLIAVVYVDFKTPKVLLHDLRQQIVNPERAKSMTLSGNKTLPHISLLLEGRFKARSQEIQRRIIDISWEISSGLRPGMWSMRIIDTLEKCGIRDG
jgi:hypothetical protein